MEQIEENIGLSVGDTVFEFGFSRQYIYNKIENR